MYFPSVWSDSTSSYSAGVGLGLDMDDQEYELIPDDNIPFPPAYPSLRSHTHARYASKYITTARAGGAITTTFTSNFTSPLFKTKQFPVVIEALTSSDKAVVNWKVVKPSSVYMRLSMYRDGSVKKSLGVFKPNHLYTKLVNGLMMHAKYAFVPMCKSLVFLDGFYNNDRDHDTWKIDPADIPQSKALVKVVWCKMWELIYAWMVEDWRLNPSAVPVGLMAKPDNFEPKTTFGELTTDEEGDTDMERKIWYEHGAKFHPDPDDVKFGDIHNAWVLRKRNSPQFDNYKNYGFEIVNLQKFKDVDRTYTYMVSTLETVSDTSVKIKNKEGIEYFN
jgi:hypothetical protein